MNRKRFMYGLVGIAFPLCLLAWWGAILTTSSAPVYAATTLVVTNSNDGGSGSLRQAIADATAGDVIVFDSGLDGQTIHLSSTLLITKHLTIDGEGHNIIISGDSDDDGNGDVRVFRVDNGSHVTFAHLTIQHGHDTSTDECIGLWGYESCGGGIKIEASSIITITHSAILSNTAALGGGIASFSYPESGKLIVQNSIFQGNRADTYGGGIWFANSSLTVRNFVQNSTFISNTAVYGGGIYNNSQLIVQNSTFSKNVAELVGGGIHNGTFLALQNSTLSKNIADIGGGISGFEARTIIQGSTFLSNTASIGGGIHSRDSHFQIKNSTFAHNEASTGGGFALIDWGTVRIENSTFNANSATNLGGGIYINIDYPLFLTMNNSIISHNIGGDCASSASIIGNLNNLIMDGSCGAMLSGDPLLAPLADYGGGILTYALLPDSPAIDAGNNSSCTTTDQRGFTRLRDGNGDGVAQCDIGAYEHIPHLIVDNVGDGDDGDYSVGQQTLREAYQRAQAGDTILFAPDIAHQTIHLLSTLVITKDITIDGEQHGLTISGDNNGDNVGDVRLFHIENNAQATLAHLTLQAGQGATDCDGASCGGGIKVADSSSLTLTHSTLISNSADLGAGIWHEGDQLWVQDSTIAGNLAQEGAGIFNAGGTATIERSTFAGNSSSGSGGALYNQGGHVTLHNSTLSHNEASEGGGVFSEGGTFTLQNSTLAHNQGGGLSHASGTLNLSHNIIAYSMGGDDCLNLGTLATNSHNFMADSSCSPLLSGDPLLGDLADNGGGLLTHALLTGSPAIDAGDNGQCLTTDQRTVARPQDSNDDGSAICDLGAYEVVLRNLVVSALGDEDDGNYNPSYNTLREAYHQAQDGDTITFAPELSGQPIYLSHTLIISKDLTINGENQWIIIRGDGNNNTLAGSWGNTRLFQVTSGYDVTLSHLVLRDSSGIVDCGSSSCGAALKIEPSSMITLTHIDMLMNGWGSVGAGIYNDSSTVLIQDSLFSGNLSITNVADIFNRQGTITIQNSSFVGNRGKRGSAIVNAGISSTLLVQNSTFWGNYANEHRGAAIFNDRGVAVIENSTFNNNQADIEAGGIYNAISSTLHISNTIIANSVNGDCINEGVLMTNTNNLIMDGSCSPALSGDPLLAPLGDYGGGTLTHALLPDSPAMDAGNNAACLPTDQRGVARPQDGDQDGTATCDIGAFELAPPPEPEQLIFLPILTIHIP